jgi:pimeloyl-ACP methyl ester carboxylesterase
VAEIPSAVPEGFTNQKVMVDSVGIDYVIGGNGPTLVLLHGYPQSWYEWRHLMPVLAEHFTVIAPSLRGAGRSDAPPQGYDKKTLPATSTDSSFRSASTKMSASSATTSA